MDPDRWESLRQLFDATVALEPGERDAFIDRVTDDTLRGELRALVAEHDRIGPFDALIDELASLTRTDARAAVAGHRYGVYRIIRELGRGGMGTVFEAERDDGEFEQRVALKLLRRADDEESRRRFLAERRFLGRLTHPNIARILDSGVTPDGEPWFAMELVDGLPIDGWCDARRLTLRQRLALFRTVCNAVEFAHRHLIVHRDLKPSNVLVTPDGTVKLLDFGIAKLLEADDAAHFTRTSLRPLTPEYASPEQRDGGTITTASDVYQLGLLLVLLLAGQRPDPAGSGSTTPRSSAMLSRLDPAGAQQVAAARASSVAALRRQLRGDLDTIAAMALRLEPERRYQSVTALSDDVQRHLDDLPVQARPDAWSYRASRFLARHRIGVSTAAAAALLIIVFGVAMAFQAGRIARERDRAERVSALLVELFRGADPWVARGDSVTVRAVLDAAPARIRVQLRAEPEMQATMLSTIADVYLNLGMTRAASALRDEVVELRRAVLPGDHPDLAEALARQGIGRIATGDVESGLLPLAEAARIIEHSSRQRPLVAARIRADHAYALHVAGRTDEARPLYDAAIAVLGTDPDHAEEYAVALTNLGWLEDQTGNHQAAQLHLRRALEVRRARATEQDPSVANSLSALAQSLVAAGNAAAAQPLEREALDIRHTVFPEVHPRIRESVLSLARIHAALGDHAAADSLHREAVAMATAETGGRGPIMARANNDYAVFLRERGLHDQALPLLRTAVEQYTVALGEDAAATNVARANLAATLVIAGREGEAVPLFEASFAHLAQHWAHDDPRLGQWLIDYGVALTAAGPFDDAEPVLRRALAIESAAHEPGHWRIIRAQGVLGAWLVRARRFGEAEPLLVDAYETLHAQRGADNPYTRDARSTLVRLYELWDQPARAAFYAAPAPDGS